MIIYWGDDVIVLCTGQSASRGWGLPNKCDFDGNLNTQGCMCSTGLGFLQHFWFIPVVLM